MSTTRIALRALFFAVPLMILGACGSDNITSPIFGAGCNKGTLSPGDTILGSFTPTSCQMEFDFWSNEHAPYVAYDVHLTKGHAYLIKLDSLPDATYNDFDARLTLWTTNANGSSIPLAVSDDDAGFHNSEIWFVAPVSGTFKLVASSYWYGGLGAFRLAMNECPVLGVLDTVGTYNFTLATSPCIASRAGGNNADTSRYSFLSLNATAGEGVTTTVTTAAFPPVFEMFGPGFDVFSNIYAGSRSAATKGSGNSNSFTMGATGGQVTIAIGGTTVDSTTGAFTITLGRVPAPVAPPGAGPWSIARLPLMARKPAPPKLP